MKQFVLQKKRKADHPVQDEDPGVEKLVKLSEDSGVEKLVKLSEDSGVEKTVGLSENRIELDSGLFSQIKFSDLEICEPLKASLSEMKFNNLT